MAAQLLFAALLLAGTHWDFENDVIGKLPMNWELRGKDSVRPTYQIQEEADGNRFLSAISNGSDVQAGAEAGVRPEDFPVLAWRWRVWQLPKNADERGARTLDSAASVYAVFGSRLFP